jgi:HlyD family secretion protein
VIEPDERSLATIALGQSARVSTEAFPNDSFEARVSYIAPSVNAKRGTIEVRLEVPKPPPYLKPDMTVSTEILVGEEQQALVAPVYAVRERLRQPWVFIVRDKHVERRSVQLGASDAERIQITSGLEAGELVVTDAPPNLTPGQRVRIKAGGGP